MHNDMLRWAPWSWSTSDPVLASVVSAWLRAIGVREELCEVSVSDPDHVEIADENGLRISGSLRLLFRLSG